MRTRRISLAIALSMTAVGLMASCKKESQQSFVTQLSGTWVSNSSSYEEIANERTTLDAGRYTIVFNEDSTYTMTDNGVTCSSGRYDKEGDVLTLSNTNYEIETLSSSKLVVENRKSSILRHYDFDKK